MQANLAYIFHRTQKITYRMQELLILGLNNIAHKLNIKICKKKNEIQAFKTIKSFGVKLAIYKQMLEQMNTYRPN
jgi:hypothetical protein